MREERKKKIVSIKVKLLGIILPVVIAIMILLAGILYFISKDIIKEYSENLLTSSIDNQTNQIEAWLNENLSAFGAVKQAIEQTKPSEQQLQAILDSYYGFHDNYPEGLYIADANGKLMAASASEKQETDPHAVCVVQGRTYPMEYGTDQCIYQRRGQQGDQRIWNFR